MRNECNIIRDILPLYTEGMVSDDTADFVKEHFEKCSACQYEYEQMKEPEVVRAKPDATPLVNIKRKMRKKKIQTVVFTAMLVVGLVVSAFAVLSTPVYFPYSEDLLSVTENSDKSITIVFDQKVTDYSCNVYRQTDEKEQYYYEIETWTSLWDQWFSKRGMQSTIIQPENDLPFTVYYASNDNEENVCIYGQPEMVNGGVITLPRLTLGYYLIFAVLCFCVLGVIWFVVRRKEGVKVWVEYVMLYPVSYVIGHFIVIGGNTTSYSMQRDFALIVFISIILYCALLLLRNIYTLRKEIREINRN